MEDLIIQGQKGTYLNPKVTFNAITGVCEIEGESYQEETFEFFTRLTSWLQEYTENIAKPLILTFKLTYFNTASSRAILDMLRVVKKFEEKGGKPVLNWYYPSHDEGMRDEAEDFQVDTGLVITLFPVD